MDHTGRSGSDIYHTTNPNSAQITRRATFLETFVVLALLSFAYPNTGHAQCLFCQPEKMELAVSKGTTIEVLDDPSKPGDEPGRKIWLPIGKIVIRFPVSNDDLEAAGPRRVKSLTEDGVWGFVLAGGKNFYGDNPEVEVASFADRGEVIFVEKDISDVSVAGISNCKLKILAGAQFEQDSSDNGENIVGVIDSKNFNLYSCDGKHLPIGTKVPLPSDSIQKNIFPTDLRLLDPSRVTSASQIQRTREKYRAIYAKHAYVWTIRPKACAASLVDDSSFESEVKAKVSASLGLEKIAKLSADLSASMSQTIKEQVTTKYGEGINVVIEFGVSPKQDPAKFSIKTYSNNKNCPGKKEDESYPRIQYLLPNGTETVLTKDLENFTWSPHKERLDIKCYHQYEMVKKAIIHNALGEGYPGAGAETERILSRIGNIEFSHIGDSCS